MNMRKLQMLALPLALALGLASFANAGSELFTPQGVTPDQLGKIFERIEKKGKKNKQGGKTLVLNNIKLDKNDMAVAMAESKGARVGGVSIALSNTKRNRGNEIRLAVNALVPIEQGKNTFGEPNLFENVKLNLKGSAMVTKFGAVYQPKLNAKVAGTYGSLGGAFSFSRLGNIALLTEGDSQSGLARIAGTVLKAVVKTLRIK